MKRKILALLLIIMTVSQIGTAAVFAEEKDGKAEIVKSGLVAWYDAVKNTENGHNADSLVWEDLAGNNDVNVSKNADSYFTDNAYLTHKEQFFFPDEVLNTVNGKAFTVEMQLGNVEVTGSSYATFINTQGNDNFSLFIRNDGDFLEFKCSSNARPKIDGGHDLFENSTVSITVEVGKMCKLYVDGRLLAEVAASGSCGAVGPMFFGHPDATRSHKTEFKSMRFYNRALTAEEVKNNSKADGTYDENYVQKVDSVDFAQPDTNIIGGMTFSEKITEQAMLDSLIAGKDRFLPANVMIYVNKDLKVTDAEGKNEFADVSSIFEAVNYRATVTFIVNDNDTVEAVSEYISDSKFTDVCVMSKNPELVKKARNKNTKIRGAIDFTGTELDLTKKENLLEIRKITNANMSKIVILPAEKINREIVTYLTDRAMTVWVESTADTTAEAKALLMTMSGTHGIIAPDAENVFNIINKYITKTALTRSVQIIGHRGLPSQQPENTLESAIAAYENGADMIEIDIYLTKDDVIVINHDAVTSHYSEVVQVEACTYEQLKKLTYQGHPDVHMPTLESLIKEFKGKDVMLVIEIKSPKKKMPEELKKLIDKYDFYDQSYVITFEGTGQLNYMKKDYPEMPVGMLTGDGYSGISSMKRINSLVGKYNSNYNPSYPGYTYDYVKNSLLRGITTRPWTIDNTGDIFNCILYGHSAITTNYCNVTADMAEYIWIDDIDVSKCYAGSKTDIKVKQKAHSRNISVIDTKKLEYTIISGEEHAELNGSELKFKSSGEVTLIASYSQIISGEIFTFYTEPIVYTVYENAQEAEQNAPTKQPGTENKNDNKGAVTVCIITAVVIIAAVVVIIAVRKKSKNV